MIDTHQELLDHLLNVFIKHNQFSNSRQPSLDEDLSDLAIEQLPQNISSTIVRIVDLFKQTTRDNQSLAQEVLNFYEIFNVAFAATSKMAQCKNAPQALETFAKTIAQAVKSSYSYYLGRFTEQFSLPSGQIDYAGKIIFGLSDNEDVTAARDFFRKHEADLRPVAAENCCQVCRVGYQDTDNLDYLGRGNILVVPFDNNDPQSKPFGTLLFVRTQDQDLFAALDMNLAESLSEMGSAILSSILYADKLHQTYLQTITSLVRAMEAKDAYTCGHSTRVAEMACNLGRYVGLNKSQLQLLNSAGLLHDIGKIGIRDDVLTKTGKLNDEEFDHIKTHPLHSYKVLEPIDALHDILDMVRHHHEHFDGSGYPDGLRGENISLSARILQIADVWDALTSTRSYREAMSPEQALEIMRQEAGTTMDPKLVKSFMEMMNQMPQNASADKTKTVV